MKPFYFVKDVIEQLKGFGVDMVDFELHVGQGGFVGTGDSVLSFSVDIAEYKAKEGLRTSEDIKKILGEEQ